MGKGEGEGKLTADDEEGREGAGAAVVLAFGRFRPVYPLWHVCDEGMSAKRG
jgi:hypothetical protein